jgi:hypothetical protein
MTTPGIRDVYRHIAGLILPKFAPHAGAVHPTSVSDFEGEAVKSLVHRVIAECSKAVPMTGDVKVFLRLASDKFGADYSPPNGYDADIIQGLMDAVAYGRITPSDGSIYLGVYDHFKGGVYKANKTSFFANDELYVDYTSLTYGTDHGRFLWEWSEVVKWPDGKYRSRFVFRGPDLRTPAPAYKVQIR